ncbi:MAG: hypothetical protein AB1657_03510 [Candidatus Micrarchaeota archaeon]
MNAKFGSPVPLLACRNGDDRFRANGERYGPVELQLLRNLLPGSMVASHFLRGSPLQDPFLESTVLARFVQTAYSRGIPLAEASHTLADFSIDARDARQFMERREASRRRRGEHAKIADHFIYGEGDAGFRLGPELIAFIKSRAEREGITLA